MELLPSEPFADIPPKEPQATIMTRMPAPAKERPPAGTPETRFRPAVDRQENGEHVDCASPNRMRLFACRNKPDIQPRAWAAKAPLRQRPGIRDAV
jgi:hypothetical protein